MPLGGLSLSLWTVYSDGGSYPNPGPCAFGTVVISPEGLVREHSGFIGHGSHQIAQITAAIRGLELTPAGASVLLISDSQYTLKGLTQWRAGWERNGWRNARKEPVAIQPLWRELYAVADARRVATRWVKGHSGDPCNERCDTLAAAALRERRT